MQAEELYFLLKPFCELGEVRGRITAQKVFYLLQSRGYPTCLDYFLHYFGPYSEDLASFLRYATKSKPKLLTEEAVSVGIDAMRFDYVPTDEARELIQNLECQIVRDESVGLANRFCQIAQSLKSKPPVDLELAATIQYFEEERGCNRQEAMRKTQAMKKAKATDAHLKAAIAILDWVAQQAA